MSYETFILFDEQTEPKIKGFLEELDFENENLAIFDCDGFKFKFQIHKADSVLEESIEMIAGSSIKIEDFEPSKTRIELSGERDDEEMDYFDQFLDLSGFFEEQKGCLVFQLGNGKFTFED